MMLGDLDEVSSEFIKYWRVRSDGHSRNTGPLAPVWIDGCTQVDGSF